MKKNRTLIRRVGKIACVIAAAISLSGCVVVPGRPWHPWHYY